MTLGACVALMGQKVYIYIFVFVNGVVCCLFCQSLRLLFRY